MPTCVHGRGFGPNEEIVLVLLDIAPMQGVLKGVVMELQDCSFNLVADIIATDNVEEAFKDIDAAFLVGAMPRREGMERRDLLKANVKIFKEQGQALDKFAKKDVKVLVVGNPANTNALICSKYAPSIAKENFTAMTRLDQNRAAYQIGSHAGAMVKDIRNVIIWGNHSGTQFPDSRFTEISVNDKWVPLSSKFPDEAWLQGDLITMVQKRGAAVIAARKLSSAMSAAKSAAYHMRDWVQGTPEGSWVSMGVVSPGDYGITEGLVYSFPCTCKAGKWRIVQDLPVTDFAREKMKATENELLQERSEAMEATK